MEFEYDPNKSLSNLRRHGVDFFAAQELWEVDHVVFPAGGVTAEARQILVGKIGGLVFIAIFTMRGSRVRLISCHRADRRWERVYARHINKES